MDDRRLRYFLAVVDEGTITRAARRLHVAQPSLSQALRAFESELGVQLFDRVGRGVRLSSAGTAFVGPARQILRAIDDAQHAISGVVELRTGTLEIAALATLAVDPMATLIGRFRERHPGVKVTVLEPDGTNSVSALIHDGTCELGAAHLPLPGEQLVAHPLGEQELLFVFPPNETSRSDRTRWGPRTGPHTTRRQPRGNLDQNAPRTGTRRGPRHAPDRRRNRSPRSDRATRPRRRRRRATPRIARARSTTTRRHHPPRQAGNHAYCRPRPPRRTALSSSQVIPRARHKR